MLNPVEEIQKSYSESLYCSIRKTWVAALPEEKIRHALIQKMTHCLGYPKENIALEKSLHQLPHLFGHPSLPRRRADLIVFAKGLHSDYAIYPLLLIECKATPLNQKVLRQIVGYNQFVKAPFISAVNQTQCFLGYYLAIEQDFSFQQGLLPYETLLSMAISKLKNRLF